MRDAALGDAERAILKEIQKLAVQTASLQTCSQGVREELHEVWEKVDGLRGEVARLTTEVELLKKENSFSKTKKIARDGSLATVGAGLVLIANKLGDLIK